MAKHSFLCTTHSNCLEASSPEGLKPSVCFCRRRVGSLFNQISPVFLTHRSVGDDSERMGRVSHCASSTSQRVHEGQIRILSLAEMLAGNEERTTRPDHSLFYKHRQEIWLCRGALNESAVEGDRSLTWLPIKSFTCRRHSLSFEAPVQAGCFDASATRPAL